MTRADTTKRMTAEEFCDWVHLPENRDEWFELVRGEVIRLLPPKKPHGYVCANVARVVGNYTFERRKGSVTSNDSGVILERDPDTVRGPDVALYEDAGKFADLHPKYGEVPPRLAVEVLSPDDRAKYVTRKVTDYLENGVALVWLLDPEARTVTVYPADRAPYTLQPDAELTGEDVLPGFRCRVGDFFHLPEESGGPPPPPPKRKRPRS
jgi:Uma2 family endonuclease